MTELTSTHIAHEIVDAMLRGLELEELTVAQFVQAHNDAVYPVYNYLVYEFRIARTFVLSKDSPTTFNVSIEYGVDEHAGVQDAAFGRVRLDLYRVSEPGRVAVLTALLLAHQVKWELADLNALSLIPKKLPP